MRSAQPSICTAWMQRPPQVEIAYPRGAPIRRPGGSSARVFIATIRFGQDCIEFSVVGNDFLRQVIEESAASRELLADVFDEPRVPRLGRGSSLGFVFFRNRGRVGKPEPNEDPERLHEELLVSVHVRESPIEPIEPAKEQGQVARTDQVLLDARGDDRAFRETARSAEPGETLAEIETHSRTDPHALLA
jgi:hypothetical protein